MRKIIYICLILILLNAVTASVTWLVINNQNNDRQIIAYPPFDVENPYVTAAFQERVEGLDSVPTAECAAEIADAVSSALYKDFDYKKYDMTVRFFTKTNEWYINYTTVDLSEEGVQTIKELGLKGPHWLDGEVGPIFLINKTTGEIKVFY